MTKIKIYSLFLAIFLIFACSDTEDFWNAHDGILEDTQETTCNNAQQELAMAMSNYENTPTNSDVYAEVCQSYRLALQNYITTCGDPGGTYQERLDDLGNCTNTTMTCEEASQATATAQENYENAEEGSTVQHEYCVAYREALIAQIDVCGDDSGELQNTLEGLDCSTTGGTEMTGSINLTAGTSNLIFDRNITYTENDEGNFEIIAIHETTDEYYVTLVIEPLVTGQDMITSLTVKLTSVFFINNAPGTPNPFTDEITQNDDTGIEGTFSGDFVNSNGGDLSITNGVIDLAF